MHIFTLLNLWICFGFRDAFSQAQSLVRVSSLTILGELVHNPIVREQLRVQGVREGPSDRPPQTSRVMITAHGASEKRREALSKSGLVVADGTCPLVRYAAEQRRQLVKGGYFAVVVGLVKQVAGPRLVA